MRRVGTKYRAHMASALLYHARNSPHGMPCGSPHPGSDDGIFVSHRRRHVAVQLAQPPDPEPFLALEHELFPRSPAGRSETRGERHRPEKAARDLVRRLDSPQERRSQAASLLRAEAAAVILRRRGGGRPTVLEEDLRTLDFWFRQAEDNGVFDGQREGGEKIQRLGCVARRYWARNALSGHAIKDGTSI